MRVNPMLKTVTISRRTFLVPTFAILLGLPCSSLRAQHNLPPIEPSGPVSAANGPQAGDSPSGISFVDVAREAGLTAVNVWGGVNEKKYIIEAKGNGLAFFDYDNDGYLDLYFSNGIRFDETYEEGSAPTSHLYRNRGDGTFLDVSPESGLARTGWQTGVCVGDFDNDGWDDLFAGFWGRSILFRNMGDGTFEDVTESAGLSRAGRRWASGCTWLDYDRDGRLDLYSAGYIDLDLDKVPAPTDNGPCFWKGLSVLCGPQGLPGENDLLFHNEGNGRFSDVSASSGISQAGPKYSITAVSYDFNNDGWPDIYVAVDSQASLLFVNQHDGTFREEGLIAGCAFSENGQVQAGMGIGVADYDGDGWLDIFKTNFQHDTCNLYRNTGGGNFTDVSSLAGLGTNIQYVNWGAGFADYDNDGWSDLFYVTGHVYPKVDDSELGIPFKTPRIVYRNLGDGRFQDVSSELGPGIDERFSSRGSAYGDYDNDGDIDVAVLNMNDPPSLLRNDGGNRNNWITLKLTGTDSNRSAIGARVRVVAGGHQQIDEVHSGGSVMSQSDLRLHFGLGKAETLDLIEITWPKSQSKETFPQVQANQFLKIEEGKGIVASHR